VTTTDDLHLRQVYWLGLALPMHSTDEKDRRERTTAPNRREVKARNQYGP
jgi:hypothetical protein